MPIPKDLTKRVNLSPHTPHTPHAPANQPPNQPPKSKSSIDDLDLDSQSKALLIDKLELCIYYRAQEAEAKEILDDDKRTNKQGVKAGIIQLMRQARVQSFVWDGLKVGYRTGTRSTVSREKLILHGVDVALVDECTNESAPFDVLSIDTLPVQP